jgi:major cell surface glycoprotein (TIGR04216 family)
MTSDNTSRKKANAVFFSVIMVLSMVAVGFAAAPAAAQSIDTTGEPEDVTLGSGSSATQNLTANQQITASSLGNNNDTIVTIDISPHFDAGITTGSTDNGTVNVTTGSLNSVNLDANNQELVINATADGSGDLTIKTVNVTNLDLNAGGADAASDVGLPIDIESDQGTDDGTMGTFNIVPASDQERNANSGIVYNETNVYQGEDDLTFIDEGGSTVEPSDLEGTSGDREGSPLPQEITEDTETGTYAENPDGTGFTVTVVDPTISTAEVQLTSSEDDVSQVGSDNAGNLQVAAEWNFNEAEDIAVTVEDPSGSDITDEVMSNSVLSGSGEQTESLDLSTEDAGEYTVIFEGDREMDDSFVVQEHTIEITSQTSLSIDTAEDSVSQGSNMDYTVSGGTSGNFHMVTIEDGDFRDGITENPFRNVDDVETTNFANSSSLSTSIENATYAYALVEIDGTTGVGSIRGTSLDDSSVDMEVYANPSGGSAYQVSGDDSEDDVSFDVEEGGVTLENPTDTYTVGSSVTVNGTASAADDVRLYVRDNDEWEPVEIEGDDSISVDSDETFEETEVQLSDQNALEGNNILSFEGRYDIGVIDEADVDSSIVDTTGSDTVRSGSIGTSDFSSASSDRATITVEQGDLTGEFATINGQIAQEDGEIDVEGVAAGEDDVLIAFVDQRGNTVTQTTSVSDDTYDEEDINLGGLSQGTVSGHVIALGRDGDVGDGSDLPDQNSNSLSALETYIDEDVSGSGDQVRSRILSNTVDADGSDDLIVSQTFRINDATLGINDVYPEQAQAEGVNPVATGETLVVAGNTNRQSDNAAITIEMLTQEDNSVASTDTDEWGSDGQWSASIDTSDLETGTYIIEADDGDSTDRVEVEIVEERDTGEDDGETDDGETDDGESDDGETDDGETDDGSGDDGASDDGSGDDGSMDDGETDDGSGDDGASDDGSGDDGSGDDGASDDTPGFGAVVALVALLAAALLATRRRD